MKNLNYNKSRAKFTMSKKFKTILNKENNETKIWKKHENISKHSLQEKSRQTPFIIAYDF